MEELSYSNLILFRRFMDTIYSGIFSSVRYYGDLYLGLGTYNRLMPRGIL